MLTVMSAGCGKAMNQWVTWEGENQTPNFKKPRESKPKFTPNTVFYLERCEAAWSQSKHHCFLLQNLQEKPSACSPPLAQTWKGSDRKISPSVHNFQAEAIKGGKKGANTEKISLKVSVFAELNGNFLRKSRVVIVFSV